MKKFTILSIVAVFMLFSLPVFSQEVVITQDTYAGKTLEKTIKIPDYKKSTLYTQASLEEKKQFDQYISSVMKRASGLLFRAAYDMTTLDVKIDVNKDVAERLMLLPGIGEKTATRMIETREKLGGFKNYAQLKEVPGIGDKKLALITPFVFIETTE